jgi:amidophosphoribosyltransferase
MCGVFGIRAPERDVARVTFFGLFALQHRGQESAGIAVSDRGRLTVLRDMGLVTQVFDEQKLRGLRGDAAIGHTRYSTTGSTHWTNAQPRSSAVAGTVALGHNGNLVNAAGRPARRRRDRSADLNRVIAARRQRHQPARGRDRKRDGPAEGAFSVVALARQTDRLPRPVRLPPALHRPQRRRRLDPGLGTLLDLVGAKLGGRWRRELVVIDDKGVHSRQAVESAKRALCIFEFFYLARPDSRLEGIEVHGARVRMGERLAEEAPADADLVMPIPDSGTPAAIGFSRASGIPFSEGLIKNRYVGRTFIQPDQGLREQGVKLKFNPLGEVAGKRIVAVDDSIVRGNTTRKIVQMLFEAGAAEVPGYPPRR